MGRRLWIALLVVGACSATDLTPPPNATPEVPGPVISVNKIEFSWTRDTAVVVTLSNPEKAPIYWVCPAYSVERYSDGWRDVSLAGACLGILTVTLVTDPIGFRVGLRNDAFPKRGWYRLNLRIYHDPQLHVLWEERSRVSPVFYVGP